MIVHLAKLQKALSENSWVRTPTENLEIENAAREYLRQQQALSDDRKAALDELDRHRMPPTMDNRQTFNLSRDCVNTIRAALQQPKDEPVSEERRSARHWFQTEVWPQFMGCHHFKYKETIIDALAAPQQPKDESRVALEAARDALDLIDCVAVRIDDNEYRIDHDTFEKVRQALAQINAALEATE